MKCAINACTWNGWAKHNGTDFDWKDFVKDARDAGYDGVEFGGSREKNGAPEDCLKFIKDQGLELAASGAGVTYNPWPPNTQQYQKSIDFGAEMGTPVIMTCGGFIPNQRRNTYDFDYDMFAGNLGEAMKYAKGKGLEIAFHPHRGCVVETIAETQKMIDRLPDFRICVDIAHLEASGEDAVKFIETFHDRIIYTHIKDYSWELDSFIELGRGDGKLNVADAVSALADHGYDGWLTVELDKKFEGDEIRPPIESAKMCLEYIKEHGF